MIRNLIFDIGGVMFDDSHENISNILKENSEGIYRKAYGGLFKECLLGKTDVSEYIETFKVDGDYDRIKYILSWENLHMSFPLMKENFDYISKLKNQGYDLYVLSNITKDSYDYVKSTINLDEVFKGGVYSFKEQLIKPDKRIYELIINRYNLKEDETLFFDDKQENVDVACELGIKGILFKSIKDIENQLKL